jgi:hypothetical protein
MADQTTSSIVVEAAPAEVMAVIADFPSYPQWVQGMKAVEVVEEKDGVVEQVHFDLEATPILAPGAGKDAQGDGGLLHPGARPQLVG